MILYFALFLVIFVFISELISLIFELTGMPPDKAKFQVISLLTGTGFTTLESEIITQHPVRRNLAYFTMIFGFAGWATIVSFLVNVIQNELYFQDVLIFIAIGLFLLLVLRNRFIISKFERLLKRYLFNWIFKNQSNRNLYTLIKSDGEYGIYSVLIEENSELIGKTLIESNLKQREIQVLNIDKGSKAIQFPNPNYMIEKNDTLLIYGKRKNIKNIFGI